MGIDELLNDDNPGTSIVEGLIAAPAPTSMNDPVYVIVLGLNDRDAREGPCQWMPRVTDAGGVLFPEVDDACAFTHTDAGSPWVIAWETSQDGSGGGVESYTAGPGLTLDDHEFSVNVDGTSVELAGGAVAIKDGGVGTAQVAAALKPSAGAGDGTEALRRLGTAAGQALPGSHASVTNSRAPNGAAGGDLAGTYPNPALNAAALSVALKLFSENKPRARATQTAAQVIATATWTPITFPDDEEYDTDGIHSTVTNTSRFSITTPGVYLCVANVPLAASAAGLQRVCAWMRNGVPEAEYHGISGHPFGGSLNSWMHSVARITLDVGDYVEFCVFQDTGGNLSTGVGAATPGIGSILLETYITGD